MLMFTLLAFATLGIFYIGYYFGNQTGRTAYVRDYLSEARKQRSSE